MRGSLGLTFESSDQPGPISVVSTSGPAVWFDNLGHTDNVDVSLPGRHQVTFVAPLNDLILNITEATFVESYSFTFTRKVFFGNLVAMANRVFDAGTLTSADTVTFVPTRRETYEAATARATVVTVTTLIDNVSAAPATIESRPIGPARA
jgi:hypothetical protein